tara:strand:- start:5733 stop:6524 length:792 start_codon:yes stop_codon:yes gene_type:complete
MRVAVCLFGNLGNVGCASGRDPSANLMRESDVFNDVSLPYYYLKKNLCDHYETDFFFHSWSINSAEYVLNLYDPKSYEFELQRDFSVDLADYGLIGNNIDKWEISDSSKFGYNALLSSRGSVENILEEMKRMAFRSSSRYYSSQKSIELKQKYEAENDFKYDFVLLTRFDNMFYKKFELEGLDKNKFYGNFRHGSIDEHLAISDHWFLGGSENTDKFGTLFDHRHKYCLRPTFSSRQHIQEFISDENLEHLLNDEDYGVKRKV